MTTSILSPNSIENEFCFPTKELSNERVKLVPFDLCNHAVEYYNKTADVPGLYAHQAIAPFKSADDFVNNFVLTRAYPDPATFLWAIIDTTNLNHKGEEGALAGVVAYMASSVVHKSTEIGFINIIPQFQRTHVTTNAVGLLLQYALNPERAGGLGLRRVEWHTNSGNVASLRVAERIGFKREGVLRWHRVFYDGEQNGKQGNGKTMPSHGVPKDLGRDTVLLGLCWDDWEDGGRDHVQNLMDRRL
ncbi:GNAT family protein [Phlyctema vagabunda]|uniref:GNAT family protein n=1 Tax=Phlyctema vagabunda TaxID=108571 RepID=A0ABR4PPJ4_9HELO